MILVILVVFHTAGINEKKKYIYHEKKKKIFDAVGWTSYCSRLWSWALGAGRHGACVLGVLGARGRRA